MYECNASTRKGENRGTNRLSAVDCVPCLQQGAMRSVQRANEASDRGQLICNRLVELDPTVVQHAQQVLDGEGSDEIAAIADSVIADGGV